MGSPVPSVCHGAALGSPSQKERRPSMATSRLNPYLSFKDNARQAMEFYKTVFGGELTISTFGEGGMAHTPADNAKIMHGQLVGSNGYWLMGSDTPSDMEMRPN